MFKSMEILTDEVRSEKEKGFMSIDKKPKIKMSKKLALIMRKRNLEYLGFLNTFAVGTVHHPNNCIGILEIMPP